MSSSLLSPPARPAPSARLCSPTSPGLTEVTVSMETPRHRSGGRASQPTAAGPQEQTLAENSGDPVPASTHPTLPTSPDLQGPAGRAPPVGASGASGQTGSSSAFVLGHCDGTEALGWGRPRVGTVDSGAIIRGPSQALVAGGRGAGAGPRPFSRTRMDASGVSEGWTDP